MVFIKAPDSLGQALRASLLLPPLPGSLGFELSGISRLAQFELGLRAVSLPPQAQHEQRRAGCGLRSGGFLRCGLGECHHGYRVWAGGVEGAALGSQGAVPSGTLAESTISREIDAPVAIDMGELSMYISLHAPFDTSR